ncbi:AFG1-like ATPase [Phytophthora infestans]|uniref:AFG1-like ATPase n=1 Tax=Phytophthora infestans TaxID=4787 RepID=A0A833RVU4_PHYIN|nr:AFG1-like ATPase [Phytophthora infestans]
MLGGDRLRSCLLGTRSPPRWFASLPTSSAKPSETYDSLVKSGDLAFDAKQAAIARRFLDKLHSRLSGYELPVFQPSMRQTVAGSEDKDAEEAGEQSMMVPRGLYVHGGVGTGKSMLLDLFFRGASVQRKRRVHFNEFMLEVQTRLNREKKEQLERYGRQRHIVLDQSRDVVLQVAHAIADESHLLCFDEFQVTDVADALIMRKLFGVLFARGVVMVATSNTSPQYGFLVLGFIQGWHEPRVFLAVSGSTGAAYEGGADELGRGLQISMRACGW